MYRLPELRDSPFSQLMATLPSLLMRMKENQTAQSNKDRQFQTQQQQQARQQFESDRAFNDANEDQIREEAYRAEKDQDILWNESDNEGKITMWQAGYSPKDTNYEATGKYLFIERGKEEEDRDRLIRLENAQISESESRATYWSGKQDIEDDMFKSMSATDKSNYDFYTILSKQAMNPEDAQRYHNMALSYLPKGKEKPTTYTGEKLSAMVGTIKSMNSKLLGKDYDTPQSKEAWISAIRRVDPRTTAAEIDIIMDVVEEENPYTPKGKNLRTAPLSTSQFSGEFQMGAQAGKAIKRGLSGFYKGFEKFNVESFRK